MHRSYACSSAARLSALSLPRRWSAVDLSRVHRSSVSSSFCWSAAFLSLVLPLLCLFVRRWSLTGPSLVCLFVSLCSVTYPSLSRLLVSWSLTCLLVSYLSLVCRWSAAGLPLVCRWSAARLLYCSTRLLCRWSVARLLYSAALLLHLAAPLDCSTAPLGCSTRLLYSAALLLHSAALLGCSTAPLGCSTRLLYCSTRLLHSAALLLHSAALLLDSTRPARIPILSVVFGRHAVHTHSVPRVVSRHSVITHSLFHGCSHRRCCLVWSSA